MKTVVWLKEPHGEKTAFFQAIARAAGKGHALPTWPMRLRGYPQTDARAADCLARAKKQPTGPLGRALKRAFLKGRYNWARHYFETHPEEVALCWQGLTGTRRAFMLGAQDAGAARLFAELAPLPGYKTLDPLGVNAEGSVPQDVAAYDHVSPDTACLADIKSALTARASRRSDVAQAGMPADVGPFLFVPLQVPDDSQMILFAGWVGGAAGFVDALAAASAALPEGWHLRLKEHPSSKIAMTDQINDAIARGARIVLDNASDSFAQVEASRGVVTVNSSMGLQAMFYDKTVIVTGRSFFALPGVAHQVTDAAGLADSFQALPDFDAGLRARFLTWLATDYYIGETEKNFDLDAIRAKLP